MKEKRLLMSNICKIFPGVRALDDVSFDLNKGEVHALIGENGAGKSTLIKILTGLYQKDSGKVTLDGKETNIDNVEDSTKLGISAIYQEIDLIPSFSVAENIFLGTEITSFGSKISRSKMLTESQKMLDFMEADISAKTPAFQLSIGQQQEVMIARALIEKSKIIIMDEVTAPLSDAEKDRLFKIIENLKKQDISVIYISHRLEEIFEIADRVTVMRDGKKIGTHKIEEVDMDSLIQMMIGRSLENRFTKIAVDISDEVVLSVKDLNRGRRVRNVSFDLHKGEILGLGGLVGAGRSEVARLIFGIDKMDSGEIELFGEKVNIKSSHDAVNAGIALIPEERRTEGLILQMNLIENTTLANLLEYAWAKVVINFKKEATKAKELSKAMSVKTPSLKQLVKKLSGGNQQKVVLAKWLCTNSKIFIFDEPTKGVDVGSKKEIYDLMGKLVSEGMSIILISSELPELVALSDRVVVLNRGEVKGVLEKDEISDESVMYLATSK